MISVSLLEFIGWLAFAIILGGAITIWAMDKIG
jgi:hypothetical protein